MRGPWLENDLVTGEGAEVGDGAVYLENDEHRAPAWGWGPGALTWGDPMTATVRRAGLQESFRRARPGLVGGVLLFLLAGCGDDDPAPLRFEGRWQAEDEGVTFTITVTDDNGEIEGEGSVVGGDLVTDVFVEGTRVNEDVILDLVLSGYDDAEFQGSFDGRDRVVGRLNGSGWVDERLTFNRD